MYKTKVIKASVMLSLILYISTHPKYSTVSFAFLFPPPEGLLF